MAPTNKPANRKPMRSNNSSDKFARSLLLLARTCRAIAKRRRKRGNAPPLRIHAAFSLVEVLARLFVLTISAVGITAAWRLADYQELLTRADRRAERVLRQYYELQTFAPIESRPFA